MRCKFINEDDEQCKAKALKNQKGYCFFHDDRPETIEKRRLTAIKAGNSRKLVLMEESPEEFFPNLDKPLNLRNRRNISREIVRTIYEIKYGKLPIEQGRAVLYGLNTLVSAISSLEDNGLEKIIKAMKAVGIEIDELN